MTKAAINMFTREAAIEFAAYGITVNSIDLGGCEIEGKTGKFPFRVRWPKETREHRAGWLRFCVPEDVGELVSYLISPEARMMNVSGIRLDGGAMLV
jgi:NAD(P)-dependent dehydrogenase (short-subunit alcohol dehydrogenase family)